MSYHTKKLSSIKRNKEFSLTVAEYNSLLECTYCAYSGVAFDDNNIKSMDRVDNDLGYVTGNVVMVTQELNNLKGNLSLQQVKNKVQELETKYNNFTKDVVIKPSFKSNDARLPIYFELINIISTKYNDINSYKKKLSNASREVNDVIITKANKKTINYKKNQVVILNKRIERTIRSLRHDMNLFNKTFNEYKIGFSKRKTLKFKNEFNTNDVYKLKQLRLVLNGMLKYTNQ